MGFFDIFKGLGKVAQTAAPFVSMANPALGAGMAVGGGIAQGGGAKNVGKSIMSGFDSFFGSPAYAATAPSITNATVSGTNKSNFLSPSQLAQQNMLNFGRPNYSTSGGGGGGGGGFLGNLFGGVKNMFTGEDSEDGKGILDLFKSPESKLGSALIGLGLSKRNPKVPDLPQSVEDLRSQIQGGGGPLRQQATGQLSSMMNEQYNPLTQPEIEASLRQLELDQKNAEDQVRDLYRNIRPGTDPSSDSSFRRDLADVQDRFSKAKADTLATRTRDTKSIFDQQRMQQIQQSLGADSEQMNQLAQIAQLDIQQIMTQLQMDYQSALNFKELFQGLGTNLFQTGTGSQPSIFGNFQ